MFGILVGARGRYWFGRDRFALTGAAVLSGLTGKITSSSGLTPSGTLNGPQGLDEAGSLMVVENDSRTGTILDLDLAFEWYAVRDLLRISLGYEFSAWNGIVNDQVRNPPGLLTPNSERNDISFSGARLGFWIRF